MLKGLEMLKHRQRVVGLLVFATLGTLGAVQLMLSGGDAVFAPLPGEIQDLPFPRFNDSALLAAPYTDDETRINRLLTLCHFGDALMITAQINVSADIARSVYESTCFPLEIVASQGARSMGHCSDFVQYIYFAGARLSNDYGPDATVQHARQCPNSSFLFGEYPHADVFKLPHVRSYWMPNIEQVKIDQEEIIPFAYQFLGKTHKSVEVIQDYLRCHSLPDTTRFMSHSSPDPLTPFARQTDRDFNSFYHAYGSSGRKSTNEWLECWKNNPEFPVITVIGQSPVSPSFQNISNIKIFEGHLEVDMLRTLQRRNAVHICPSSMEGYGHYISEARAMGALVVTTDFGPMNEFVVSDYSGILIKPEYVAHEGYMALEKVAVHVSSKEICASVKRVLKMPLDQRKLYGDRGRRLYEISREEMKRNLERLKTETVEHFSSRENGSMGVREVDAVLAERNRVCQDLQKDG
jgi:glycosyltransferase involved in cell wall biosynthesis